MKLNCTISLRGHKVFRTTSRQNQEPSSVNHVQMRTLLVACLQPLLVQIYNSRSRILTSRSTSLHHRRHVLFSRQLPVGVVASPLMALQVTANGEGGVAEAARVGPLSRVAPHVDQEVGTTRGHVRAVRAAVLRQLVHVGGCRTWRSNTTVGGGLHRWRSFQDVGATDETVQWFLRDAVAVIPNARGERCRSEPHHRLHLEA